MDEKAVYSIVSKMMIAEELHGSWDQPTRTIVMHSIEASKVQSLAGQFADKATVSVCVWRAVGVASSGHRAMLHARQWAIQMCSSLPYSLQARQ
jgi:hypothetical protein